MIDPFGYYQAPIQFLCPSCHGERRVFRMTPSYGAMEAQAAGGSLVGLVRRTSGAPVRSVRGAAC